jgi:cobalt-zinc-cadmium efflux system protein
MAVGPKTAAGSLKVAISITLVILVAEAIGGLLTGSLALLSDAGHVFMDSVALFLSLGAVRIAQRPANQWATFGYHRAEVLTALVNGAILLILVAVIFFEGYRRLTAAPEIRIVEMLSVATVGLAANVYMVISLRGFKNLNIRSAFMNVLGDTLASVGVVTGGVLMYVTGNFVVDPVVSIFVGALILIGGVWMIREAAFILMERPPRHVDLREMLQKVRETEGVRGLHDVHVWSICSNVHAMSAHVLVQEGVDFGRMTRALSQMVSNDFEISHTTFQLEVEECEEARLQDSSPHIS